MPPSCPGPHPCLHVHRQPAGFWWEGSEVPPSCPGPRPCLPAHGQPAGPQATQSAARRGPGPSARPSRPRAPVFGSLFAVWGHRQCGGQRRFTPFPCYRPPPHLAHRRCSVHITGWADAPDSPWALAVSSLWGFPRSARRRTPPWEACSQHCPCLFSSGSHGFILSGIQVPLNIFTCRFIELF